MAGVLTLVNEILKLIINRPRPLPEQVLIIGTNDGSGYPSGHTFFATIFLGITAYLLFTHIKNKSLKITSLVLLILLILLVGVSRIYLGAHWPSDVIGAYIISSIFLTLLIWGYQWGRDRFNTWRLRR
jgi:undecaprenyl-diphosphatase